MGRPAGGADVSEDVDAGGRCASRTFSALYTWAWTRRLCRCAVSAIALYTSKVAGYALITSAPSLASCSTAWLACSGVSTFT